MKYFLIVIIVLLFSTGVNAQTTIEVIFDDSKSAAAIDNVEMFDDSQVEYYIQPFKKNVKFLFKKKMIDSYWLVFLSGKKRIRQPLPIWLDKGSVKIMAHADSFKLIIDTVLNSPFYYKSAEIFKEATGFLKQKDTIAANKLLLNEYKDNAENPFSIAVAERYLRVNQLNKQRLKPLKELMDNYGVKFGWVLSYKRVIDMLNKSLVESSINLTDFEFTSTQKKITKANFENAENIVLDFWFLQCAGCIADHKIVQNTIHQLRDKKIELIGISTDKDIELWKKYLVKNNYNWQNLYVGKNHAIYAKLYLESFPYYVIISKSGEIRAVYQSISQVLDFFEIKSN